VSEALRAREEAVAAERRRALRRLVREPLLLESRDPEAFAAVVRHRAALGRWFAENAGWSLVVEAGAGYARLMKRPGRRDATRPARLRGKPPFDRRRYTLLFLALAALDDGPAQTTLARLAEGVRELSLEDASLTPFDPEQHAERAAFVDVLRLLDELGVLALRDGDADRYARNREGDALYDVRERLLGQLLAAPVPPALAGSPGRMTEEERAQTEEGERVEARQTVFRRLLDDPVVYMEDLPARAREWLEGGRGFVYERLAQDVGLLVERRLEGLAAVDPHGELTDALFPDGSSTVKHAALLLCEWLCDRARGIAGQPQAAKAPARSRSRSAGARPPPACVGGGTQGSPPREPGPVERRDGWTALRPAGEGSCAAVPLVEILAHLAALRSEYGSRWSKEYEEGEAGTRRLAADALALLAAFGLAVGREGGWIALPAAARFAPAPIAP
jgi:uncharacterized protein (TIGR02678 family)